MLNNEEHDMQLEKDYEDSPELLEKCNFYLLKQQLLSLYGYPSIQIESERIMAYLEGIEESSEPDQKKIIRTLISFIGEVTLIPESDANSVIRERVQQFLVLNKIGIHWSDSEWNQEVESLFETRLSNPYYTNLLDNKFEYSRFFQFLDSPLPLQLRNLNHQCFPQVLVAKQMDDFKYLCNLHEFKNMRKIRRYIHQIIEKLEEFRVLQTKIESRVFEKCVLLKQFQILQGQVEDVIQQNLRLVDSTKKPILDDQSQTGNHETHTQTVTMPISQEIRNKKLKKKQKMQQKMNETFVFPLEMSQEQSKESSQDGRKLVKISEEYLEIMKITYQEDEIDFEKMSDSVDKLQYERNSEQSGCIAGQQISLDNKEQLNQDISFDKNSQSEIVLDQQERQFDRNSQSIVEEQIIEPEILQFESYEFGEKVVEQQQIKQNQIQIEETSKSESIVEIVQVPKEPSPNLKEIEMIKPTLLIEPPETKDSTMQIQLPQEMKNQAILLSTLNDNSWLEPIEKQLEVYCSKLNKLQKLGYPCLQLNEAKFEKMIKGFNQFYQDKNVLINQIISVIWETLTIENIEIDAKGDEYVYGLIKSRAQRYLQLAKQDVQSDVLDKIVNSSFERTAAMPYCSEFEVCDFSFEKLAKITDREYPQQITNLKCLSSRLAIKTKSVEYLKQTFHIPDVQNIRITRLFIKDLHSVLQKMVNFYLKLKQNKCCQQDIIVKQFNSLEQEYLATVNKKLNYKLENKAMPKLQVEECIVIEDKDSYDNFFCLDGNKSVEKEKSEIKNEEIECEKQVDYVNLVTPQQKVYDDFTPNLNYYNILASPCIGQQFFGQNFDHENVFHSPESKPFQPYFNFQP